MLMAVATSPSDTREERAWDPETRGITLLMTVTLVSRAGSPAPAAAGRLREHAEALRFYLDLLGDSVEALVVADNARGDLAPLRRVVDGSPYASRVEFLRLESPDQASACGRAYEEFRLADRVMDESRLVERLGPTDKIWKVTGRYRVVNLARMVAQAPERYDVYCNARNWPAPWLDLGLIGWSRAGYEAAFRGVYRELREDRLPYPPEVHMRAVLDRVMGRVRVVRRFTMQPRIEGVRGTDGCAARRPLTPWLRV